MEKIPKLDVFTGELEIAQTKILNLEKDMEALNLKYEEQRKKIITEVNEILEEHPKLERWYYEDFLPNLQKYINLKP